MSFKFEVATLRKVVEASKNVPPLLSIIRPRHTITAPSCSGWHSPAAVGHPAEVGGMSRARQAGELERLRDELERLQKDNNELTVVNGEQVRQPPRLRRLRRALACLHLAPVAVAGGWWLGAVA